MCLQVVSGMKFTRPHTHRPAPCTTYAPDFGGGFSAFMCVCLAMLSCRSIGIDDVMPREQLLAAKAATLQKGYSSVQVRLLLGGREEAGW